MYAYIYICLYIYVSWKLYVYTQVAKYLVSKSLSCEVRACCRAAGIRSAIHCNVLQHTAAHYNTLQHTVLHYNTLFTLHNTAPHCTTLHHTAPLCNTPQHTATHNNTLQHVPTQSVGHSHWRGGILLASQWVVWISRAQWVFRLSQTQRFSYGVATISRLLKIIGLFCTILSL